jgi:hypothetical protein
VCVVTSSRLAVVQISSSVPGSSSHCSSHSTASRSGGWSVRQVATVRLRHQRAGEFRRQPPENSFCTFVRVERSQAVQQLASARDGVDRHDLFGLWWLRRPPGPRAPASLNAQHPCTTASPDRTKSTQGRQSRRFCARGDAHARASIAGRPRLAWIAANEDLPVPWLQNQVDVEQRGVRRAGRNLEAIMAVFTLAGGQHERLACILAVSTRSKSTPTGGVRCTTLPSSPSSS